MAAPTVNWAFPRVKRRPFRRRRLTATDGDTPPIEQAIRMVSCDTPEKAVYAGKPATAQGTTHSAVQL